MNLLKKFKQFSLSGNLLDLATMLITGSAFGKKVSPLVGKMAIPLIGLLLGTNKMPKSGAKMIKWLLFYKQLSLLLSSPLRFAWLLNLLISSRLKKGLSKKN